MNNKRLWAINGLLCFLLFIIILLVDGQILK